MTNEIDYFKTFCTISKALGTTLGREEILDLIVQSSVDSLGGKAAALFLLDEAEDVFRPVAQKGLSHNYLHARPMQAKRVVEEILHGGYISIYDATADPRLENHEEKKVEGIASILVVPVMTHDKAIGVLSLYTAEHRRFTEDEIEYQLALAEQGAMAIERSRLVRQIRRNSDLFYYLASNINSTMDIEKILHILTAEVADSLGFKVAAMRLLNKEKGTLDLVTSYGLSERYTMLMTDIDESLELALNGDVVIIDDLASDTRVKDRAEALKEGIVSGICVPIKSKDEVIGIFRAGSDTRRHYDDDLIQLLRAIADQGGLAIENARLFQRIKTNTALFYDLASSINSSLDLKKILHILTSEIADTLNLKGVEIRLWNKDNGRLDLVAHYALSEEYLKRGPVTAEKGVGRALRGESVVIQDVAVDDGLQYRDAAIKEGIASMLLVPIKSMDEVIGIMGLCSPRRKAFPDDMIQLVNALAHQGGLAIQNASMYLMLQEDKKTLEGEIWSHKAWF